MRGLWRQVQGPSRKAQAARTGVARLDEEIAACDRAMNAERRAKLSKSLKNLERELRGAVVVLGRLAKEHAPVEDADVAMLLNLREFAKEALEALQGAA